MKGYIKVSVMDREEVRGCESLGADRDFQENGNGFAIECRLLHMSRREKIALLLSILRTLKVDPIEMLVLGHLYADRDHEDHRELVIGAEVPHE